MAIAIFLLTLTLVIWQPRGLGIGFSALGGALFALATGVVTLQDVSRVWAVVWDATFTLIALSLIYLILDEAGFFRWLALVVARAGVGCGRLLFPLVILLGVLITAVLTNNGTALLWTPVVMEMMLLLRLPAQATLAFVFATGFIADAASSALPTSNLVNTLSVDAFQISYLRYFLVMIPVNVVVIATSVAILWFYFERHIPPIHARVELPLPYHVIRDRLVCQWSFAIFGLLSIGFFFGPTLGVPTSFYAAISALVMLALAGRWLHKDTAAVIEIRKVLREVPWQVILFSLGLYFVVFGLRIGITALLRQALNELSDWGVTLAAAGTGFLATFLSSLFNNVPTVLINAQALQDATAIDPTIREVMVYANLIGCNIGAKITPIGSVSSLLWLYVLVRKGLGINWTQYVRMAFVLTIPVLFVSLLSLAIWLPWLIA